MATKTKRRRRCQVCGRLEGSTKNIIGEEDGLPLGRITKCELCKRWACPDCLHESDCCFDDEEDHADEPGWAPLGWRLVKDRHGLREYEPLEHGG